MNPIIQYIKMIWYYFTNRQIHPDPDEYECFCDECIESYNDINLVDYAYNKLDQNFYILEKCVPNLMYTLHTSLNVRRGYLQGEYPIEFYDYCTPIENMVREFDRSSERKVLGIRQTDFIAIYAPYLYVSLASLSNKFHALEDLYFPEHDCLADTKGTRINQPL